VRDFIDTEGEIPGRPSDLVGLVSFATYVQSHCPLTLDHAALLDLLAGVEMPGNPRDPRDQELLKTAIGDALIVGVERLRDLDVESRVLVLLSDGESNVGEAKPVDGAEAAKEQGIKVYTIGVGTPSQGLDEDTLEEVAEVTGGKYFNARSATSLKRIYEEIDRLERSEIEAFQYTRWRERYPWFVLGGVVLLLLHRVLMDTRFRSLP
jgi:Ca-activated chloride channel family protein